MIDKLWDNNRIYEFLKKFSILSISIQAKQKEINDLREDVLQKANERGVRLQQEYRLQEFKFDAQEVK